MNNNFKIGDKVRRINCDWKRVKVGDIVTIKDIINDFDPLYRSIKIKEYNFTMIITNFVKLGVGNPNSKIIIKEGDEKNQS